MGVASKEAADQTRPATKQYRWIQTGGINVAYRVSSSIRASIDAPAGPTGSDWIQRPILGSWYRFQLYARNSRHQAGNASTTLAITAQANVTLSKKLPVTR